MGPEKTCQNRLLLDAVSLGFSRIKKKRKGERSIFRKKEPRENPNFTSLKIPQQPYCPTKSPWQAVQNELSLITLGNVGTSHPAQKPQSSSRQPGLAE